MTLKEYERKLSRRIWRRRLRAIGDLAESIVGIAAIAAMIMALAWLTPNQTNAENDRENVEVVHE